MRGNNTSQSGFVAIIVTMILMVVILLISIGFIQIIGREQRQVLDRQLSNQAFYAAETGVNDAARALSRNTDPLMADKTECGPAANASDPMHPYFPADSNIVDASAGIEYSCLLIDRAPRSAEYSAVEKDDAKFLRFNAVGDDGVTPVSIDRIRVSWQTQSGFPTFASSFPNFLPATGGATNWGANTGVLRMTITPLAAVNRDALINNTYTTFLYPSPGAAGAVGSTNFAAAPGGASSQGTVVSGQCNTANTPRACNVEITGISGSSFMITIRSIYTASTVKLTAHSGGSGAENAVRMAGAQSLVDSTGKSGDVLRRIMVRIPARNTYAFPSFVINSADDICKQYSVLPPINGAAGLLSTTTCTQ